jgi:hypothetical protein
MNQDREDYERRREERRQAREEYYSRQALSDALFIWTGVIIFVGFGVGLFISLFTGA